MKKVFLKLKGWVNYQLNSIFNSRELRLKKKEAVDLWNKTGRQHHIIPVNNKLVIVNNISLKQHNKRVKKHQRLTHVQLMKLAYFSTPSGKRIIKTK